MSRAGRRPPITRLGATAAHRWHVTIAAWVAVLVLGAFAYFGGLSREGFPPVNVPIVVVDGSYFVDDPVVVDADVALPLHEAYRGVPGVRQIQTFAQPSSFAVVVEFDTDISSPEGARLLEAATPDLGVPASVTVRSVDATKFIDTYDLLVSVSGPDSATAEELQTVAGSLAERLAVDDDIAAAEVRDLVTSNIDASTGDEAARQTRFTRVAFQGDASFRPAIAIGVIRDDVAGLDVLEFSDEVEGLIGELDVEEGYAVAITADFANDIRAQISSLTGNLFTGLLAVAAVSLLLIGWRVAMVTAAFMATVMLASLLGLWLLGYSLNTITLFGLILTLGLLVDDAIVVSESVDASRDEPEQRSIDEGDSVELGIIRTALNRVGAASFAGTLTTVLVFAPLLFVGGILGEFIRAIPATVILTLLLSFLFSMTVIPALGRSFLLRGGATGSPLRRAQEVIGERLGALAAYPSRNGARGVLAGVGLVVLALGIIVSSFGTAGRVGFNIFPEAKDTNNILVGADFDPGVTIEQAESMMDRVDEAILDVLGGDLVRAQYVRGNERVVSIFIDLVPFDERSTTSPTYVERLEPLLDGIGDASPVRLTVSAIGVGPPAEDFPFAAQISVSDGDVGAAQTLAGDIASAIRGVELPKDTGDDTLITDAIVSTDGHVFRTDGVRQIEIRASFDTEDTTNNLNAAEQLVDDLFPADELTARGLPVNAIDYDFGLESDNQEDFASLGMALMIALVLMFALLIFQFRSVMQPALIFLAIPFSFFGVFNLLAATDNTLSFFVAVGFIALIGVVVNNTILLVDAANQARREGATSKEAIRRAVVHRFRPLIATTVTTVVGLLPLALSDPFWEGLSFTLIGGLVSSTLMVLVVFPVFYLAVEAVRTPLRNAVRRRRGRELIT